MAKTKAKRLLSLLLSLAMVMSLVVTPAFAITGAVEESVVTDDGSETATELYSESGSVASVSSDGGTAVNYDTLAKAINAATDGSTVKLICGTEESVTFASSYDVTLDLNGYTLTSASTPTINITGTGTLTIVDSGSSGAIYNTKSGGNAIYVDNASAALNVESGTIKAVGVAINVNAGTVNLSGGTFEGGAVLTDGASATESTLCLKTATTDTCTVTVTGGFYNGYAFAMPSGATTSPISVSGGYYTVSNWSVNNHLATGCSIVEDTTYTDYSYTVTGMAVVVGYYDSNYNFTAVKGYTAAYMYNALSQASTLEPEDGQTAGIVLNADYTDKTITIPADATMILDLNGYTVGDEEAARSAIAVSVGASLTIIDSSNGSGTVTSANTAGGTIRNYGGTLVIEDGTYINTDQTTKYAPVIYSAVATTDTTTSTASTTINGGTYSSYGRIVHLNIGALTVNGGVFTAKAIHYAASGTTVTNYTSSVIATNTVIDNTGERTLCTYIVNRAASVTSGDGDTVTYYETLADAVSAATSGDTITLLANTTVSSLITVSDTVILDLNGYTVSAADSYTGYLIAVNEGGNLTVSNSNNEAAGTLTSTNRAILVYSGGTLAVTGGTVHGDSIGIFSNGGTVTVSGGTVSCYATSSNGTYTSYSAIYCDTTSGGSLSITDGEVSGYRGIINWGSTVTISGGTVSANSAACAIQQTGDTLTISNGTVTNTGTGQAMLISQGASATISGGTVSAPYVKDDDGGVGVIIQKGTLTMTGGTVSGGSFGICTNGTNSESYYPNTITISGGTVSGRWGMYLPAVNSETTISGNAQIIGSETGIEIRAGSLTVTGGEITGNGTPNSFKFNGSGTTVIGAGIGISQHTTNQEVTVTVTGGAISGYYGIFEVNTNASNTSAVTLTIKEADDGSSATINSTDDSEDGVGEAIYSMSVSGANTSTADGFYENSYTTFSVSGGTFSTEVDAEYCADGYTPTATADGKYGVTEFNLGISTDSAETKESVPATIMSEKDGVMYVKVSAKNISSNYTTSAYPTTDETWTSTNTNDSGKYIFAGWYTLGEDGSYTACSSSMWDSTSEDAVYYAKFVDANVLSVICVYTPESVTGSNPAWRFVSSLDSGNHDVFYFCVGDTTNTITTYYSSSEVGSVNKTFTKSDFSTASEYVTSYGVMDNATTPATSYTVKAGWKTSDGTTVYGTAYSFDASGCTTATILYGVAEN